MSKLRVAVIGAGYFGRFHHDAWARMPEVDLVATLDLDKAKANAAAKDYDVEAVYDDLAAMLGSAKPDIIDITSPPETHLDLIRQIAPHGIAMQCQKPFCDTLEQAREAIAISAKDGVTLGIHENFRHQPWHRQIKTLLDGGAVGDVYQATFRMRPGDGQGADAYLARQPYFQTMPRFLVRESAIHQIDLFRYFFGEPSGCFARLKKLNPFIQGEDAGMILFDFPNGERALFDGNRLVDHSAKDTRRTMGDLVIEGSHGTLRLDGNAQIWLRKRGSLEEAEHHFEWNDHLFGGDCVYETCRAFYDHVANGSPLENAAETYLVNREIEEAVYRSNEEGRWIALNT